MLISNQTFLGHPDFSVSTAHADQLEVSLTATVNGKPSLNGFAFKINGLVTDKLLPIDADKSSVEDALMNLFAPKCPNNIGSSIGRAYRY